MSEKQSFSQKCSMLSQYLKENGSFGDLSLGMSRGVEPNGISEVYRQTVTPQMNFYPVMEKPRSNNNNNTTSRDLKFMNLFPQQQSTFVPSLPETDLPKPTDFSVNKASEPQRAQMTIFYGGQVIVLNDFPADKAKEVMALASQECARSQPKTNNNSVHVAKSPIESSGSAPQSPKITTHEAVQAPPPSQRPNVCDLPIARKASLHRFLEKRKDRISAKSPYQINCPETTPSKPVENRSWLGLAAQSTH